MADPKKRPFLIATLLLTTLSLTSGLLLAIAPAPLATDGDADQTLTTVASHPQVASASLD